MRGKIIGILTIVFGVVVGSIITYIIIANPFSKKENPGFLGCQYTSCTNTVKIDNTGISAAVSKVYDAVVMIENYNGKTLQGSGSGFIYKTDDKNGYIMTNQHVVEKSSKLKVRLTSGDVVDATLAGGDEYLDIAIVKIPVKNVKTVVAIGKTKDLKLGDSIFTIGSPVGDEYFNTVTSGIISGLNRKITVSVKASNDWLMDVLQVDAAINPGNSGGPLANSNGEVIGINSVKISEAEGIGFAMPINIIKPVIESFVNNGSFEEAYLGIFAYDKEVIPYLKEKSKFDSGIYVTQISKDRTMLWSRIKNWRYNN